jgi:hypothetical protein
MIFKGRIRVTINTQARQYARDLCVHCHRTWPVIDALPTVNQNNFVALLPQQYSEQKANWSRANYSYLIVDGTHVLILHFKSRFNDLKT